VCKAVHITASVAGEPEQVSISDVTKHRTARTVYTARSRAAAHRAVNRRAQRVTGRIAPSSVLPFTYSTLPAYFPAYSVKTQAPSSGCFNYISARCAGVRGAVFRDTHLLVSGTQLNKQLIATWSFAMGNCCLFS